MNGIMKSEIEQIVSSDETARATVGRAEMEAEKLISEAKEKAQTMLTALEKQIQEAEDNEIASIVTDARHQAQLTMEQTEQYIEKLRKRLDLQKTRIVNDYINSALKRSYS